MALQKVVSDSAKALVTALVQEQIRADARIEGTYYVEMANGQIIGLVCLRPLSRYLTEVKHLWVRDTDRNRGIARQMLMELDHRSSRPLLCSTVLADNAPSRKAFEVTGYRATANFIQGEDRNTVFYLKTKNTPARAA